MERKLPTTLYSYILPHIFQKNIKLKITQAFITKDEILIPEKSMVHCFSTCFACEGDDVE